MGTREVLRRFEELYRDCWDLRRTAVDRSNRQEMLASIDQMIADLQQLRLDLPQRQLKIDSMLETMRDCRRSAAAKIEPWYDTIALGDPPDEGGKGD